MLEELEIRNLGPIHQALISPSTRMTAITGETGAGKTMLLNAIRLISGGVADPNLVGANSDQAWAQAIFCVDRKGMAATAAHDAGTDPDPDGNELFLARSLPASGRSRAMLNGHAVPKAVLAGVTAELITIHGQADQLRIASDAAQRNFLDSFANDDKELDAYHQSWLALTAMDERLARLRNQETSIRQQADYLRESLATINGVDPHPGEDDELKEHRDQIENSARIAQGVSGALAVLDSSQMDTDAQATCAVDLITQAAQSLHSIGLGGVYEQAADRLKSINADLSDVIFSLSDQMDMGGDEQDLDSINTRIHALGELTRRWGPTLSDVIAWRDKTVFEVEDLDASPEKVTELELERLRLFDNASRDAHALHEARLRAAQELAQKVDDELSSLAMAGAQLKIRVIERKAEGTKTASSTWPLDGSGVDDIDFLFRPFPDSPLLAVGRSASGGELSRLMLAMELAEASRRPSRQDMTFIFDEVDAGVGGKAAVELGKRLAQLAQSAQVIVVTHLPQVASWAQSQFVVTKDSPSKSNQGVATTVSQVHGQDRIHEIARMLSGSESVTSLDHAGELLESSRL